MKKTTSMSKDSSNLSQPRFGYSKKPDNSFVKHMGNIWFVNKLNKYCVCFGTYRKRFVICDPESLISIPAPV